MKKFVTTFLLLGTFLILSTSQTKAACQFSSICLPAGNQFLCNNGASPDYQKCCNNPLTDCFAPSTGGGATGGKMEIDLVDPNSQYAHLNNLRPSGIFAGAVNILFGAAGIVAFLYLLWGGYSWITSGGDKEGMDKARKRITSALIGLALVFSVYALVFIIRALFGVNTLNLSISPLNVK